MAVANVELNINELIQSDRQLRETVERNQEILETIVGDSRIKVTANWDLDRTPDGSPTISLRLQDFTGSATATFTPAELATPKELRIRFYKLWGELLRIRSHQQLDKLYEE